MPLAPYEPRYRFIDTGTKLRFELPPRRPWYNVLFLALGLLMWGVIGSQFVFGLGYNFSAIGPDWFWIVWSLGWVGALAFNLLILAYMVLGGEVLEVDQDGLMTRRHILGVGRTLVYDARSIKELRASPQTYSPWARYQGMGNWGLSGGQIAFDYGARTLRLGSGLDEGEARQIVATIRDRFKRYRRD